MAEISGWLSPDGDFHQQAGGHTYCAEIIGKEVYNQIWIKAEYNLRRRKWARIASCGAISGPKKLTDKQWLYMYQILWQCYNDGTRPDYIKNLEYSLWELYEPKTNSNH